MHERALERPTGCSNYNIAKSSSVQMVLFNAVFMTATVAPVGMDASMRAICSMVTLAIASSLPFVAAAEMVAMRLAARRLSVEAVGKAKQKVENETGGMEVVTRAAAEALVAEVMATVAVGLATAEEGVVVEVDWVEAQRKVVLTEVVPKEGEVAAVVMAVMAGLQADAVGREAQRPRPQPDSGSHFQPLQSS